MVLTFSIDEQLAQRAQQVAESKGMSLDQLIRNYLEDLTAQSSAKEDVAELSDVFQARGILKAGRSTATRSISARSSI